MNTFPAGPPIELRRMQPTASDPIQIGFAGTTVECEEQILRLSHSANGLHQDQTARPTYDGCNSGWSRSAG